MTVAPGPQLSTGRLRVDAARAIAKLRDYQLADRTTWILEGVRAAVASGATSVDVQGDSNDVWLRWQGPVWPRDELPRLFDELVSPEPAREGHHLRLLATAVNSALGLDPAYVDVIAIPATGPALSARYEPGVLADAGSDALRAIAVREIARPDGDAGMLVHLRRSPGLDTLSYLLHGATPPELAVVIGACRDLSVPIRVGATQLQSSYLVRLPLGDDLGGYLAIIDPAETTVPVAIMEVAERGVVLVRYEIDIGLEGARGRVPVRLFVDAPRMPTNAARSQVRRTEHPIAAAERRAKELMPQLVAELVDKAPTGGRERAAALALIAAAIAGPSWHETELPSLLWPLSSLPLLRNAIGESRPIATHWQAAVYEAKQPLPIELSPWLSDMLWIPPGDDAAMLVGVVDWRPCRRAISWAKKQLSARTKFHRYEKRIARVNTDSDPRMRLRIGAELAGSSVQQVLFDGVFGELCIRGDGIGGEVVVLVDGRELERLHVDARVPFDAAVESVKLSPGDRYLGVARDAGFRAIETALAAAVVRGLEAIALALVGEPMPDGYTPGLPDREADARYVRGAFSLAIADSSPLVRAPAWPTFDGRWLSLVELRALPTIGIALFERAGLRVHLPGMHLIDYENAPRSPFAAAGCALAVTEPGIRGTIEPALESSIVLHHAGARLAEIRYRPKLVACRIVADVDAAIPDDTWSKAIDTAGIESFDFEPWELAFIRAVAAAMIGDPIEALHAAARDLGIGGPAARTVWAALTRHRDVIEVLGDDLYARFRAHRMFHAHGDPDAKSVVDLGEAFPVQLPFVDGAAPPVVGYAPLVADREVAGAVAKLAGRVAIDGAHELERRRASEIRDARLRAHMTKVTVPYTLAGGFAIQNGAVAPGTSGGIELDILVDGRPFKHLVATPDLPLKAIVDVDDSRIDDLFEALDDATHKRVLADIRAAAGPLVLRDALATATSLGDPGPLRSLTVAALEQGIVDHATREVLCTIAGFATVQGGRVALASLRGKPMPHAAWDQPWIDGDTPDPPVLRIPEGDGGSELRRIITALLRDPLVDASHDVAKSQAQRRIARGMLPVPSVPDARPELKKRLDELGQLGKDLGPGEIALVAESQSIALLHVAGEPRLRVELDVLPPVCIAIEAPDLVAEVESFGNLFDKQRTSLTWHVQELAVRLVRKVITPDTQLPNSLRHGLRRAVLACKFDPAEISGASVVETTAGTWLPWSAIDAQLAKFGEVWATMPSSTSIPLDDTRIALRLTNIEIEHGCKRGIAIIDASTELALDDTARKNRARRPAMSLEIPTNDDRYLGFARLPGDGTTAARGTVAILHPSAFDRRGVVPHMAMHPFDPVSDPCAWPTFALVDDARLTPGRTWERPVDDAAWKRLARDVQLASDEAWRSVVVVPPDAVAAVAIGPASLGGLTSAQGSEGLQIHGALWLASRSATVWVIGDSSERLPVRRDAIGGRLYVHAPHGWRRDSVVNDLCVEAFPKLARIAVTRFAQSPGRVAAHVAMALALGRIGPGDAGNVTFDCFDELPVDAETLVARLRQPGLVHVADRDTELVAAVSSYLGGRARRGAVKASRPAPVLPSRPAALLDPLEILAQSVRRRLDEIAIGWSGRVEVDRHSPMLAYYNHGTIMLGNDPQIAAIAANPKLVDLLVAHVVTVLDIALTEITSSSQATAVFKLLQPQ